jgi:hypothetical protein
VSVKYANFKYQNGCSRCRLKEFTPSVTTVSHPTLFLIA